ncbi:COMM domain-containing 4 [Brachionus plicatilis]|uniref:COMM domain-containing 4 n=1 Tax=Brachionus plicatilis TaxID=10195 RepID=A0A3M7S419_BRAPC|nr:COMM domain-containing 4 [Brachionus plicatilis]
MKFRFCGDLDCPDWILAEIATISKISSIKAKQLTNLVSYSIIKNEEIEKEKLEKLANDSKLEFNDIKACVALLEFVLKCSVKYGCNGEILSSELQQLGLPKEHSTSICKVYDDIQSKLEVCLKNSSLKLNGLESITWRLDYIFSSNLNPKINEPLVNVKFKINNIQNVNKPYDSVTISLDSNKLKLLIHELKQARSLMSQYESSIQNVQS